jgi:dihydroorotase
MRFDLLIKGGEVLDAAAGYNGRLDVAINRDRIAAVAPAIPTESAHRVIDAHGQLVTPGLIDLHTHIYRGATYWGVNADIIGARSGVTTWLDVGSAGAFTLPGFREFIVRPARVRIFALLNISSIGLVARNYELANLEYCDVRLFQRVADLNRDLVLGVKVRMGTPTVGAHGIVPLERARQAADECGLPLMVHIAVAPPTVEEVLRFMRPGDILTHCFTGQTMRLLDDTGAVREAARQVRDAGIIMDIGHGAGSFSFTSAEALMASGYRPDTISSDVHQESVHGPMFDMPTVLSKFLCLGMSLPEVFATATTRPAEVLGMAGQIGTLAPGALADVALFRVQYGRFTFYDIHGQAREGDRLLHNTLTLVGGQPLPMEAEEAPAPWVEQTEFQRELVARGHTPAAFLAQEQAPAEGARQRFGR